MCDNDDCYEEEEGWVHVGDCEADGKPLLTQGEAWQKIAHARKGSFLARYGSSLMKGLE